MTNDKLVKIVILVGYNVINSCIYSIKIY